MQLYITHYSIFSFHVSSYTSHLHEKNCFEMHRRRPTYYNALAPMNGMRIPESENEEKGHKNQFYENRMQKTRRQGLHIEPKFRLKKCFPCV